LRRIEARREEFTYLRTNLDLSAGNLSQHLGVLQSAGLITLERATRASARTWIRLTGAGRRPRRGDHPAQATDQPDRTKRHLVAV